MENTTVIDYRGTIQYETIGELIHKFKRQVHSMGVRTGTYKKLLLVMIESLENIMKHSECPDSVINSDELIAPGFSILKKDENYIIISSNSIRKQGIPVLKKKLDYLNSLDQQGLKDYYKQTITNGEFTNRGGAGLGLIEMAKISGNTIKYDFFPIDERFVRFTQWITIDEGQS